MSGSDWKKVTSTQHYSPSHYLTPQRLASVGHQIALANSHFAGCDFLEIGVGSGLTAQLLREQGTLVTTLDIDERLCPEIIGSVTKIPMPDASVDCFICCQVLEHLPWEALESALEELFRVSRKGGIISVPTNRPFVQVSWYSAIRTFKRRFPVFWIRNQPIRVINDTHYWELGSNVRTVDFQSALAKKFTITKDYQANENPYHHFFCLLKDN